MKPISIPTSMTTPRAPAVLLVMVTVSVGFMTGARGQVTVVNDNPALDAVFTSAAGESSLREVVQTSPVSGLNASCFDSANGYSNLRGCITSKCVSSADLAQLYNVQVDTKLQPRHLGSMTSGLLYVMTQSPACSSEVAEKKPPGAVAVWGYGFLFVTLINACSLFGALVVPCMNLRVYKRILTFMVALAVGTLAGSGLLMLIPEALELGHGTDDLNYLWKTTTVMGGIYMFFCLERIMRIINSRRQDRKDSLRQAGQQSMAGTYNMAFTVTVPEPEGSGSGSGSGGDANHNDSDKNGKMALPASGESAISKQEESGMGDHSLAETGQVAPVAYMIIFGDALHNLIDGLSIGAAFTDSTMLGISVSVAVVCEELPHELGDFAILLNSGLTFRKALCYNFLSSLSCYFGLVIGIVLGENTSANTWIFAIAGGMFLYISLADMLPEMTTDAAKRDAEEFGEINTFILQNIGIVVGFGIILFLAVYSGEINFTE